MKSSIETEAPVDDLAPLPLAIRKRISNIVALGGTVFGVERVGEDHWVIKRTVPGYREEVVRA